VERFEYDPNRSANLALLKYADGERAYILAPKGLAEGGAVVAGETAPISVGNCLPLRNIPVGTEVHAVEMRPARVLRSHVPPVPRCSWSRAKAITRRLRLRSGEMRKVH
jgi:large subunit ribosomal protein L2